MNIADTWLGSTAPNPQSGNVEVRANDTARLIDARPSYVIIERFLNNVKTTLPIQKVRLEVMQSIRNSSEQHDAMIEISKQYVILIGYKDHPTIPDTNVQRADRFFYLGRLWEVSEFIDTVPGRLLVSGELTP